MSDSQSSSQKKAEVFGYDVLSREYGIKLDTCYWLVHQKKIPHIRLGPRLVRFSRKAIEEWFVANTVMPSGAA